MWGFFASVAVGFLGSLFSRPKKPTPPPPPPRPAPPPPPPPRPVAPAAVAPPPQIIKIVETKSSVDYQGLVDSSRAAGFNPLTALRNGGAAGFQVTNTPFLTSNPQFVTWQNRVNNQNRYNDQVYNNQMLGYNSNAQWQRDTYNHSVSVLENNSRYEQASRTHWANAFTQIAGSALRFNPAGQAQAATRRVLENRLLVSEIGRNNRSNRYSLQPSQAVAPSAEWLPGQALPGQVDYNDILSQRLNPTAGKVTVTNPWTSGEVNPGYLDAETFEQRYGDVAQEIAGARNAFADAYTNIGGYLTLDYFDTHDARGRAQSLANWSLTRKLNYQKSNYWSSLRAK